MNKDHDKWFKDKVQKALDCDEPLIPHAEAMTKIRAKLDKKPMTGDTQ